MAATKPRQRAFAFAQDTPLTCGNGEPWPYGPHPLCEAESARLRAEFAAAVARGEYDAAGHVVPTRQARR